MDETSLRALLDRATEAEPPMGALVSKSILAGRRIRRRRAQAAVAVAAAVGIAAGVIPAALAGHGSIAPEPQGSRPAVMRSWPVAFIEAGSGIVPVRTATGTVETLITIPGGPPYNMAIAANGKGFARAGTGALVPVDLSMRTAGRPIAPRGGAEQLAITPNGRTGYAAIPGGILPIRVSDAHLGRLIRTPAFESQTLVVTPDSRMLYVGGITTPLGPHSAEILPVQVATNTVLKPITIPVWGGPLQLLATPDSKTVVVLNEGFGGVRNTVVQVDVATSTPMPPVPIRALGAVSAMVLAPDGRTAYVVSASAVTPVDLATNSALPAIGLPAGAGNAYGMVISPDGTRLYVLTPRVIVPISTVTRKALKPIGIPRLDYPTAIAVNPNGRVLYVGAANAVVPISTATGRLGHPIVLGGTGFNVRPWSFAFLP